MNVQVLRCQRLKRGVWKLRFALWWQRPGYLGKTQLCTTVVGHGSLNEAIDGGALDAERRFKVMITFNKKER